MKVSAKVSRSLTARNEIERHDDECPTWLLAAFIRLHTSGQRVSVPVAEIHSLRRRLVDHLPASPSLHELSDEIERRWLAVPEKESDK